MPLTAAQQMRLRDDLQGLIKGDARCDEVTQQLFATDGSILQSRPDCIVCPRNTDDVIAVVQYAAEEGIPIHSRGAGTSLTGESLGEGIVLVFSRYMRRILNVGDDFVTVQPGVLRRRLNQIIDQSQNRIFGPLAGNVSSASLGSIIARNGAGLRYLRYGLPSDHLVSMNVVLANGDLLKLDRHSLIQPLQGTGSVALAQEIAYGKEYIYAGKVARLLENRTSEQLMESAHRIPVCRAGYAEHAVLRGTESKSVDLARLFAGSEGTLGIIVEATLKTVSPPQRKCAAAFFFDSIFKAVEAVSVISPLDPVLCELIDRRRLNMVRDWDARYHPHIPADAEAALLVELDAGTLDAPTNTDDCRERLGYLLDRVQAKQLSYHVLHVNTEHDFQLFDQVIRRSELVLGRMSHAIQPVPLFDDVAVPLDTMNDAVMELLTLFQQHKVTASLSGHVGQGHLRIHPLLDLAQADAMTALHQMTESVYSTILRYGGTVSAEWGTGLLKSQFLPSQFPHLFPLFQKIKETFDPQNLLNPGKVIPQETHWTQYIRHGLMNRGHLPPKPDAASEDQQVVLTPQNEASPSQLEIQLKWEPSEVFESAHQCNGCGECLRVDRQSRICPLFRGTAMIEFAPRSKPDLLRGILEHDLDLEMLTGSRAKEIADTCFHCRMCDRECPSKIDTSMLSFRIKAAYAAAHGLPLEDLAVSRLDTILNLLTHVSSVFNAAMRNQVVRWLVEKTFRIPQRRVVPPLASRPYLNRIRWSSKRHRLLPEHTDKEKVALFVDVFANHFDPQLAELAVQILEHHDCSVHVPVRQRSSGRSALVVGDANKAERLARYNISHMSELIRQGYTIVTLEPESASCLTKDYRYLVGGNDSELMEENVVDFCSFLHRYALSDRLRRDFRPLPYCVGYHAPCCGLVMSASLVTDSMPAEELLHLIPDLNVQRIEQGCCGMAGLWGFQQKNYRHSLHIGIPLFRALRQPEIDFGVSDCNACCSQMSHGSRKRAHHPIRLLAAAYGFLPADTLVR
ncbi:MAG: FAD-binding protein [Planctomycetaceae bacterium]|jgi:FAD/FMN-containing dehydrogenase/Fe-S oxidoreductase|nr:FAD-binding protein [Planctomycetaceae bacterium]